MPLEFPDTDLCSLICHRSKLLVLRPGLLLVLDPIRGLLVVPGFPTLLEVWRAGDDGTGVGPVDVRRALLLFAGAVARLLTTIRDGFIATCCCLCCSVSPAVSSLSLPCPPEDEDE